MSSISKDLSLFGKVRSHDLKSNAQTREGSTVFLKAVLVLRLTQVSNKNTELCYQKRLEELQPGTNKLVHLTVNVEMGFPKLN